MSNLPNLIDDCLLCILDCLPLRDLLCIQRVSRRWKLLARHAAARKRLIKLFSRPCYGCVIHYQYDGVYRDREKYYKRNAYEVLIVGDLITNIRFKYLVKTFPNITSLEFRQINAQAVNKLVRLLNKWPKLVTLKLFVGDEVKRSVTTSHEWNCWLEHICTTLQATLRHLVIYERASYVYARIRLPANFARLQLESFHCGLLFEEANISMDQIAQLPRLRTFGFIPYYTSDQHDSEPRDQFNRVLHTKFSSPLTELMLMAEFDCGGSLQYRDWANKCAFYHNYSTLTHLSVRISEPLHWLMLDSGLHRLDNLVYLNVLNWFVDDSYVSVFKKRRPWCTTNMPKYQTNPRYNSLRTLHLAHLPCYTFVWAVTVLPNIETLQMDGNIRRRTTSTHSCGRKTIASIKELKSCRQVIYCGQVYPTEPELRIVYQKRRINT